jgi:hypothetical protein
MLVFLFATSTINIIVHCSIQETPIRKLTALKIMLENISCQILRRVHIVTYKISHQFYMVTTIAKPYIDKYTCSEIVADTDIINTLPGYVEL